MTWIHNRKKWIVLSNGFLPSAFVSQKCNFFIKKLLFNTLCAELISCVRVVIIYINANTLDAYYRKFWTVLSSGISFICICFTRKGTIFINRMPFNTVHKELISCRGIFIISVMEMPSIHITKCFRQYYLAISLPFALVLQNQPGSRTVHMQLCMNFQDFASPASHLHQHCTRIISGSVAYLFRQLGWYWAWQ